MADASIFYVPMDAETFVPITTTTIAESYVACGMLRSNASINELQKILKSAVAGKFDGSMVRARIEFGDGQMVFVDRFGGIKTSTAELRIGERDLRRLKNLLEHETRARVPGDGCK